MDDDGGSGSDSGDRCSSMRGSVDLPALNRGLKA